MLINEIEKILDEEYGDTFALEKIMRVVNKWTFPRPICEDGYPLGIGDTFMYGDDTHNLSYIEYHGRTSVLNGLFELGIQDHVRIPEIEWSTADGHPIEVGKRYYNERGVLLPKVAYIRNDLMHGFIEVYFENYLYNIPNNMFANKPVRDVDGEIIRIGDTVYEVETGLESKVTSITMIDSDGNTIRCKDGCIGELHYKPHELTHREPDSLGKLRDDLEEFLKDFDCCDSDDTAGFINRLTALIERGA